MPSFQMSLISEPGYVVREVSYKETQPFILDIHYARRMPPIKVAYGLFLDGALEGVCTYGIPPSHTLLKGVCGEAYKNNVIELNRLCLLSNRRNEASVLISRSLKMLGNRIVVSYADSAQGHVGYIYQATNFLFTGKTKPIKEIYLKSRPELHHTTHRGQTYAEMLDKHGGDVAFRKRSVKNRYVIFVGSKSFRKKAREALRYPTHPYPKQNRGI